MLLERYSEEIKRLETIITQVLNSSFHIVKRYADINSLLKDIEVTTTLQTLLRNIEASFEYNEIPLVNIDAFQIEQTIRNIINNAIDAMPDGGQLIVRTGVESDIEKPFSTKHLLSILSKISG